ncbi:MAG: hypothetical protein K1X28_02420 [Parachlamydiales bacterium]|nr:hypothetical protein [Parachlamydiales bacterium]
MKFLTSIFLSACSIVIAFDSTIPVLHLPDYTNEETRSNFIQKLETAASEVGFFALTGTGVDPALLDESYDQLVAFFSQDFDQKIALKSKDGQRGYIPGESAKGETRIDFKEFYHIGREDGTNAWAENVWPEYPTNFKPAMIQLYEAMDTCKLAIGNMLTDLCHLPSGAINEMIGQGDCLMRAIHYPENPPADAIWAGAHTDIDFFTILPRSTARGLQVLNKDGEWIDVIVPDGAFIINCGDMLENISNGYFRSSIHRVVDSGAGTGRYSVVFFVHPRSPDRLDPLPYFVEKTGGIRKYANVTRMELLAERLIDLGLASKGLMEFFVNSGAVEKLREVGRFSPKAEEALKKAGFELK